MNLAILDASVYLKYGTHQQATAYKESYGIPTGGLEALVNAIALRQKEGCKPIVCFDSQTDRKNTYEGYKGNRKPDPKVWIQANLAYHYLTLAGIQCIREEGVEADDLIIQTVKENKDPYGQINVYTTDMDLAQVVDKNTRLISPTCLAPSVDKDNYSFVVCKKRTIPYNSILLYKLFYGDKSDNMKALKFTTKGFSREQAFQECLKIGLIVFNKDASKLSDPTIPIRWVKLHKDQLSPTDLKEVLSRIKIFYPKKVTVSCKAEFKAPNKEVLAVFFELFKLSKARDLYGVPKVELTKSETDYVYNQKFKYVKYMEDLEKNK